MGRHELIQGWVTEGSYLEKNKSYFLEMLNLNTCYIQVWYSGERTEYLEVFSVQIIVETMKLDEVAMFDINRELKSPKE